MSEDIKIIIKKAALHILDTNLDIPVLSNDELEIEDDISDFLENHIIKALKDNNLKKAEFAEEENRFKLMCSALQQNINNFLTISQDIAGLFFEFMKKNVDIFPADLLCCIFEIGGVLNLGILKMNYKQNYIHFTRQDDCGNVNTIIKQRTVLPAESQRVDECVFIDLETYGIYLIEKAYEINGEKEYYISKYILNCSSDLSAKDKIKIINKVADKMNRKYFDQDFENISRLKKAIAENFEENNTINIDNVVKDVFKNNPDIQKEYVEEVQKAGIAEKTIEVPQELVVKKYNKQKIKTDTGIEINFPSEYYDNTEKLEFINNPDGTISILIKNVTRITNR